MQMGCVVESIGRAEQAPDALEGRVGFEISFWIAPANRVEFLQTALSLLSLSSGGQLCRRSCFERVGAENTFLWRESWGSRKAVEERLLSPPVETLLGAIEVLGRMEELKILEFVDWVGRGHGRE